MVKMEVLKFDENGQGYFDFEALEMLTDWQFVECVKEQMIEYPNVLSFVRRDSIGHVYVYLTNDVKTRFSIVSHYQMSGRNDVISFTCFDIEEIVRSLGGVIQWQK